VRRDDAGLGALADRYGTPLYVYDGAATSARLAELRAGLGRARVNRTCASSITSGCASANGGRAT
jgi:hypothetical protein